jgi:hypothetical protein
MQLIRMHPAAELAIQAAILHDRGSPIKPWRDFRVANGLPDVNKRLYLLACRLINEERAKFQNG